MARLGAGGMGEVYRARDTVLGRDAAIKVLPPDKLQDHEARQRFLREARAASALSHPGVVTVYEIGQEDGTDFIAMEFVAGDTLQAILRERRLGFGEAAGYALQAADALAKPMRPAWYTGTSNPATWPSLPTASSKYWTSGWRG